MADINTAKTAKLEVAGKVIELPIVEGTEHEKGMDISALRASTGYITLDDGYGNTGSCQSGVTFIDGDNGILRYRGIPIEELADKSNFMKYHFESFPSTAHPMAILSSMINASSCYYPGLLQRAGRDEFDIHAARLISQVRTIAAFSYRKSRGLPIIYPKPTLRYTANFLHMLFSDVYLEYDLRPEVVRALDLIFILHADHEQNCSTSTVRMVASAQANLFASAAAGVCALWGPLHGGANQAVIEMLTDIHRSGDNGSRFIAAAKEKGSGKKLMGFGHRIYKNYDPRARIIKKACDSLLVALNVDDPLLDIAKRMEESALSDAYFVERKLYPNVDFYSGIIMRALGIPTEMFTVVFAIGRMPGWIAHFKEIQDDPKGRIYRPRQIYVGQPVNHFVPMDERVG